MNDEQPTVTIRFVCPTELDIISVEIARAWVQRKLAECPWPQDEHGAHAALEICERIIKRMEETAASQPDEEHPSW